MYLVILLQLLVYLVVFPFLNFPYGDFQFLVVGVFLLPFFLFNYFLGNSVSQVGVSVYFNFSSVSYLIISLMSVLYVYISYKYGLYERRLGVDAAINRFVNISLYVKLFYRAYEVLMLPIVVLLLKNRVTFLFVICLILWFVSFLMSGVIGSKASVFVLFIYLFVFLGGDFFSRKYMLFKFVISVFFICVFFWILLSRLEEYGSFELLVKQDFVKRLDGLDLPFMVYNFAGFDLLVGSLNLESFKVYLSSIPFLYASYELKMQGLTSIKSYILSQVLGFDRVDHNSTFITDSFYILGLFGLVISAFFFSLAIFIFRRLSLDCLNSPFRLALLFSIFMSFFRIEDDFFGRFLQLFFIFLILFVFFSSLKLLDKFIKESLNG